MTDAPELHVAGVIVHARPLRVGALRAAIDALPGAEVFQSHADGRMVVVLEAHAVDGLLALVESIRTRPGVLNVALVYQHAEPAAAMHEEMSP
ncbi:MAG TPA: chaperone NapD [Gemmatimonadales bacterium]|nr:chaperone NapD [Gemmatimonadales bacterium]